jgi:protein TonB
MKTKKITGAKESFRIFMVLFIAAIALSAFSSCGKNKTTESSSADSVYTNVDVMPVFTGGDTAILNYIARNTIYPEDAKKNGIQGKVIVKLVVLKDGTVSDVEVLQSANPLLDAEAIRVVKTIPKFEKPGIKGGKAVAVNYMLPISFKLN